MAKIIFAYRLVSDTGFAPCVDNGMLTLACCKGGQIRNGRNILTGLRYHVGKHREQNHDDEIYILGIYKNKLLYYAMTTDIIKMTDYFSQAKKAEYGKRKDHIYDTENGLLQRNSLLPHIHPKGSLQNDRDANGVYVIVSERFEYYGVSAPPIPGAVLTFLPKARDNKKYSDGDAAFEVINEYISDTVKFNGVIGKPHDPIKLPKCGGGK